MSRSGGLLGALAVGPLLDRIPATGTMSDSSVVTLALCGDVMTGRGIDQVLPHPSDPTLYEPYVKDARRYVDLAEAANGEIPSAVEARYPWGDALEEIGRRRPDATIINLETAITRAAEPWPGKGIHYRMHPQNIDCLTAAGIDCCALANNHTLDWGYEGLVETVQALDEARLRHAGAGRNLSEAEQPAILETASGRRILIFSAGVGSSGIPSEWAATEARPGLAVLDSLSEEAASRLAAIVESQRRPGDRVVLSIHWGSNWGYEIPLGQRRFAQRMIDEAGVDVVHGHSSHHPKGIEIYRDRPILYGCGDFLNDYEGIGGHERFRPDLTLLYVLALSSETGRLAALEMVPFRVRRFRLQRSDRQDAQWLCDTLNRVSRSLATGFLTDGDRILLRRQRMHTTP